MHKVFLPTSMCSKCKGFCCKKYSGGFAPDDFKEPITLDFLTTLFDTGLYSIDCYEGHIQPLPEDQYNAFFIRPRHKDATVIDYSWGGECVLLTDEGCSLSFEERPLQCKSLKPMKNKDSQCVSDISKFEIAKLWIPYNDIILELMERI